MLLVSCASQRPCQKSVISARLASIVIASSRVAPSVTAFGVRLHGARVPVHARAARIHVGGDVVSSLVKAAVPVPEELSSTLEQAAMLGRVDAAIQGHAAGVARAGAITRCVPAACSVLPHVTARTSPRDRNL
jgi:hypothetical protein